MPIFRIQHITRYEYDKPVKESVNEIRIYPYASGSQEVLQHDLQITDQPAVLNYLDYWGNRTGSFNIADPHTRLVIESMLVVRVVASSHLHLNFNTGWDSLRDEVQSSIQLLELTKNDQIERQDEIDKIVAQIHQPWKSIAAVVQDCCQYIYQHFQYIKGITTIETTVDELLEHRAGVCQDFAHVMLQMLRTLRIPSRYVSGYVCPNKSGMRGEGATHAWVEAWIPQHGWAGIDPTNNVWVTNTHVKLAVGRNFTDCSPVKGTFKGPARQKLSVYVSVGYEDGNKFEDLNNVRTREYQASMEDASEGPGQQQ